MEAIALIETYGMITALEAADAALKTANVEVEAIHNVGGGIMTVSLRGDVGAVKVAADAGAEAAARVGKLLAVHVIPRMDNAVAPLLAKKEKSSKKEMPTKKDGQNKKAE